MKSRQRYGLAVILGCALLVAACATSAIVRARQTSVTLHAALAAIDDSEQAAFESKVFPKLTQEVHDLFSQHMAKALRAGLAFNEAVIHAPESPEAHASFGVLVTEVAVLDHIAGEVLPEGSIVRKDIAAVNAALAAIAPGALEVK